MKKSKNLLSFTRVSTDDQEDGASLDAQDAWLDNLVIKEDLNEVRRIHDTISGKLFPVKYHDEIMKIEDECGIDVMGVYQVDRFSRSYPYGAWLTQKMHEKRKLTIITNTARYDFDNSHDRFVFGIFLVSAEMDQGSRFGNVMRSVNYLLKNGAYPFLTPFGYEKDANNENKNKKDKDHTLRKKVWCDEVINCLYDTFECVKSFGKTAQKINDKYIVLKLGLTGAKARRILQNKIYIGYLNWGGEIFGCGENNEPRQELMAVSKEKFDRVQFIISQIKQKYNRDEDSIIDELIEEYGLAPVQAVCNLKAPCPKCGGIEIQNNGKEPKDWLQRKYICKDCGNEYRFPLSKHIKKIEKLVAQPCPKCGTTNQFALINDGSTLWQLRCKSCGFITFLHQYNDDHKVQKIQDVKKEKNGKKITSDSAQKSLVIFEDHVHDDMKDGMIVS